MKEVMEFLVKSGVFYLATVEGDQPRVRPMGFVMECGGRPAFCTGKKKAMYRQMIANPRVEICAYDGQGNTLRLCGKAVFATSAELQQKALDLAPSMKRMYSVGDGNFEIFYLDEGKAIYTNMNGETRELAL
ncbi:MAG: pyridoxamine 5'-phosphate oxidase family protein [Oscillospiraceae bacterium]|nr:pyridoxamine 5'-phosphate oxidase family protein [Oscillospiraceae bacterium]